MGDYAKQLRDRIISDGMAGLNKAAALAPQSVNSAPSISVGTGLEQRNMRIRSAAIGNARTVLQSLGNFDNPHARILAEYIDDGVNLEAVTKDAWRYINGSRMKSNIVSFGRSIGNLPEDAKLAGATINTSLLARRLDLMTAAQLNRTEDGQIDWDSIGGDLSLLDRDVIENYAKWDDARLGAAIDATAEKVLYNDNYKDQLEQQQRDFSSYQELRGRGYEKNFTDINDVSSLLDWMAASGTQVVGSSLIIVGAGILTGGTAWGVMGSSAVLATSEIMRDLAIDEEGLTMTELRRAVLAGTVSGAIELGMGTPARIFGSSFRKSVARESFRAATRNVSREVMKRTSTGYVRRIGRSVAGNAIEEFIQEGAQTFVEKVGIAGMDFKLTDEVLLEMFNSAMAGAFGGGSMGLALGTRANIQTERMAQQMRDAGVTVQTMSELAAVAKENKLIKTAPATFTKLAGKLGLDNMSVYYQAETLETWMADSKVDPADVLPQLGITEAEFTTALNSGGSVSASTSGVMAYGLSNENFSQWFQENGSITPQGFSAAEAADVTVLKEAIIADLKQWQEAGNDRPSFDTIKTLIKDQVRKAGRSAREAEAGATLVASFFETTAVRYGGGNMTGTDMFKRFGLQVAKGKRGPQSAEGGYTLTQGSITQTPAFQQWFGDSKVVDADGNPLVVYHGTNSENIEAFDPAMSGQTDTGYFGTGFYFSRTRRYADSYSEIGSTVPVYLSLQNPLEITMGTDANLTDTKAILRALKNSLRKMDGVTTAADVNALFDEATGGRNGDINTVGNYSAALRAFAEARGHDGIIVNASGGEIQASEIVVFDPTQIKSVDNVGTFDANDPRILYQGAADPRSLEATFGELETRTFPTGRELKVWLQERAIAEQEGGLDLTTRILANTPQAVVDGIATELSKVLEADARYALQDNAGAIGWYDRTTAEAMWVAGLVYPELNTDANARVRFMWALAATSNGIKVDKNFDYAAMAYEGYNAQTGFPELSAGEASSAINLHLKLYHDLNTLWGADALRQFMMTEFTVADVKKLTGIEVSGENADTVVRGAAIIGAKLGNGFYSNLNGVFDALTIDRWNMRTVGRVRGTLIEARPDMVAASAARLQGAVASLTPKQLTYLRGFFNGKSQIDADRIGKDMTTAELEAFGREVKKRSAAPEWRDNISKPFGKNWTGDEVRLSGNSLWNYMDGQVEIANNGTERGMIRDAHQIALEALQADPELNIATLNMSDLQALLWYPEKRLYDAAKQKEGAERGYEDDEAPDYANAARKWATARGVTVPAAGPDTSRAGQGDQGAVEAGAVSQGSAGFDPEALRDFRRRAGIRSLVGGGDPRAPRKVSDLVSRKSLGDGASVRGLNVLQKLTAPKNKRFGKWMSDMGVALPPLYELASTDAQAFADAITASKTATPFGAAVYVYETSQYADMRLYITEDGGAGFAVKPDGDIVSVFGTAPKGVVDWLLQAAIDQGGRKLDAYDTVLPLMYSRHGFKVVQRDAWNENYMPDGWDKELFAEFNNGEPDVVYMVFDENYYGMGQELSDHPTILYQGDGTGPRGQIALPKDFGIDGAADAMITLFQSANKSTFFHEAGHFFLNAFAALAFDGNAPQDMLDDMYAINEYLGRDAEDRSPFTRDQQEVWARSFEAYTREGKAPSSALRRTFDRLKAWMVETYARLTDLQVTLTPEITGVMDRMLATAEEIEHAKTDANMSPLMIEQANGMSDATWLTYKRLAEAQTAEGKEALLTKLMDRVRLERTKEFKELKAGVEADELDRLQSERAYSTITSLQNADEANRLNEAQIIELVGKDQLVELRKHKSQNNIYNKAGTDIHLAAEQYGFKNATAMLNAILKAQKMKDELDDRVSRKMAEDYPDMLSDGTIREEAMEAMHNDNRGRLLVMEADEIWRQLEEAGGDLPPRFSLKSMRAAAKDAFLDLKMKGAMQPEAFLRAERTAAREAQSQFGRVAKGSKTAKTSTAQDLAAAHVAKRRQLLNHLFYIESKQAVKTVERITRQSRNLRKASAKGKVATPFVETLTAMFKQYGFRNIGSSESYMPPNFKAVDDNVKATEREAAYVVEDRVSGRLQEVHYSQLTVEEFQEVADALLNLEKLGRDDIKALVAGKQVKHETVLANILTLLNTNLKFRKPDAWGTGNAGRASMAARGVLNSVLTSDTILNWMDGSPRTIGYIWKALKGGIAVAMNNVQLRQAQAKKDIAAMLRDHYTQAEIMALSQTKIWVPSLNASLTKNQLLSMALNTGNEQNFDRIINDRGDVVVTRQGVIDAVTNQLTENDWRFVNAFHAYINSFWGEIEAQSKRITGVVPTKVDAIPQVQPYPWVTGGYYPIKYDSRLATSVSEYDQATTLKNLTSGRSAKAQTRNGHKSERLASVDKPVLLDLAVGVGHVNDVIYDLELSEPVTSTWRLINSPQFKNAMMAHGATAEAAELKRWVQGVANGNRWSGGGWNTVLRHLRTGLSISKMAFSITTIVQQPLGLMQSAVAIGKVPVTKALFKYASAPREAQKAVEALSPFMVERMQTFQRDMALISGALDEDPTFSKWGKFQQSVVFAGFLAIQKSQYHLVDLPTWMAAFDQEIAGGASTEDAVVVADTMVARAQGSGLLSDRTGFERGDLSDDQRNVELARVFTVFGSYMISGKFNVMMQRLRGTNWKSPADMLNTMVDMMMLFALEGLLAAWVTGRGYDEDEDEKGFMWWWFTETAQTAAATMPFIRDTVSILQGFDAGGAVGGLEKMLVTAPVNATNLLIGDDDARMRNLKQVINAGGVLTKLPATQVNRLLTAILDDDLSVRDDINPLDTFFGRRDK